MKLIIDTQKLSQSLEFAFSEVEIGLILEFVKDSQYDIESKKEHRREYQRIYQLAYYHKNKNKK